MVKTIAILLLTALGALAQDAATGVYTNSTKFIYSADQYAGLRFEFNRQKDAYNATRYVTNVATVQVTNLVNGSNVVSDAQATNVVDRGAFPIFTRWHDAVAVQMMSIPVQRYYAVYAEALQSDPVIVSNLNAIAARKASLIATNVP